jgi:hypothetical protein
MKNRIFSLALFTMVFSISLFGAKSFATECSIHADNGYFSVVQGTTTVIPDVSDLNSALAQLKQLVTVGACPATKTPCEMITANGNYAVAQSGNQVSSFSSSFEDTLALIVSMQAAGACAATTETKECTLRMQDGSYAIFQNNAAITPLQSSLNAILSQFTDLVSAGACAKSKTACYKVRPSSLQAEVIYKQT